jgi:hypothetical protein
MNAWRICVLATALAASMSPAADSAPAAILKRLATLAGPKGRDCGAVALASDHAAAIACAVDAESAGQAYRVAVELHGTDAPSWQGAARDERGKRWVVFYEDSNPSGGPAASITLSVVACREIVFDANSDDIIDCKPFIGEP